MAENSIGRKRVRDDLKIDRAKLFEQFLKHPIRVSPSIGSEDY